MSVERVRALADDGRGVPLGTAAPGDSSGEIAPGYVEREYLVHGRAASWVHDAAGRPTPGPDVPYTTRVLIRRPATAAGASGVLLAEPLHPMYDQALAWKAFHPWIMRAGATWVGVTQHPHAAASMATEFDPGRYGEISVPGGTSYQVVADVLASLRDGRLAAELAVPVEQVLVSGWSATGSFWRVFLGEGFHHRLRRPGGGPVVDGVLICISSGGAGAAGYPPLADGGGEVPPHDPRRTIGPAGIPVIELLSELEAETHAGCLRPDGDEPDDRYRLYEVAGTSHDSTGPATVLTNAGQYWSLGLAAPEIRINETPADGRLDHVARAVLDQLSRWARGASIPPPGRRLSRDPAAPQRMLHDRDGNALGGVRPPWITAPVARYAPHSTPAPGPWQPSRWAPMGTAEQAAAMRGHMEPFTPGRLRELHGDVTGYLRAFTAACDLAVSDGFLLPPERDQLLREAADRRPLFDDRPVSDRPVSARPVEGT